MKESQILDLEKSIKECEEKLERARLLIIGLGSERLRWGEDAQVLIYKKDYIPIQSLISSSAITYFGALDFKYR